MKKKTSAASKVILTLTLLFFYLPILYIIVFSFNDSRSLTKFGGFSLRWYEKMFADSTMMEAVLYTVVIAILATVVSTIVGTVTAIGLSKSKKVLQAMVERVNDLPVMNPDIVTGISLLMFFSVLAVKKGFLTLLLAHIMFCIPYVMLSVTPKLRSLDPNLIDAAMDLGATPFQALTRVIVPQIRPGIVSGALIAFTMSFDDFVISYFTTGNGVKEGLSMVLNPVLGSASGFMFSVILLIVAAVGTQVLGNLIYGLMLMPIVCVYGAATGADLSMLTVALCVVLNAALVLPSASPLAGLLHGNTEWVSEKDIYKYSIPNVLVIVVVAVILCATLGAVMF